MNSLTLKPEIQELYKLNEYIHDTLKIDNIRIDLIVEEIFVNIVNYSKCDYINVNLSYENNIFTIEFIDNGIEFNPLLKEDPVMPDNIEEFEIGGLGIHLTKEISNNITYEYLNDENHLKITKTVE